MNSAARDSKAVPGAAIAIQTFGDFLGFNPHLHVLISDGCFHESGLLTVAPNIDIRALERLFRHHVLTMLLDRGKITKDMIALLNNAYLSMKFRLTAHPLSDN